MFVPWRDVYIIRTGVGLLLPTSIRKGNLRRILWTYIRRKTLPEQDLMFLERDCSFNSRFIIFPGINWHYPVDLWLKQTIERDKVPAKTFHTGILVVYIVIMGRPEIGIGHRISSYQDVFYYSTTASNPNFLGLTRRRIGFVWRYPTT